MKKQLIIAFSILFVVIVVLLFMYIEVMMFFGINPIKIVRVKPAELYSDYVTTKDLAEEIFAEELKDTEYTASNIKPIIHVETDCPTNESGWVTYPHGHEWCDRYYRVADMAKASIKKDGKLIDIYCYLDEEKEENRIVTDAYFDDISNGFVDYLSEEIAKIAPHEGIELMYFWGHNLWNGDDNAFPYQLETFDKVLADQSTQIYSIVDVYLTDDAVVDRELCEKVIDLVPFCKNHEVEYHLWQNGGYHVIKCDRNTGELIVDGQE